MTDEQAQALLLDEAMDRWLVGGTPTGSRPSAEEPTGPRPSGDRDGADEDARLMAEMAVLFDALGRLTEEDWDAADVPAPGDAGSGRVGWTKSGGRAIGRRRRHPVSRTRAALVAVAAVIVVVAGSVVIPAVTGGPGSPGRRAFTPSAYVARMSRVRDQVDLVPAVNAPGSSAGGEPQADDAVISVDCVSDTACAATAVTPSGSPVLAMTTDGGDQWSVGSAPGSVTSLGVVVCVSAQECLAVGKTASTPVLVITDDDGLSWALRAVPDQVTSLTGVACGSIEQCVAVGKTSSGAVAVTSDDGGDKWSLPTSRGGSTGLGGITRLTAVACPSLRCVAVGSAAGAPIVMTSDDGGSTWTRRPAPAGVSQFAAVYCTELSLCWVPVVEDDTGTWETMDSTDNGNSWAFVDQLQAFPDHPPTPTQAYWTSVACTDDCPIDGPDNTALAIIQGQSGGPSLQPGSPTSGDIDCGGAAAADRCWAEGVVGEGFNAELLPTVQPVGRDSSRKAPAAGSSGSGAP